MTDRWATFDCYGTLIDWERGITDTFSTLWPGADRAALLARYHACEREVERGSDMPYRDVLAEVLERVARAERLELTDRDALSASLPEWPPFTEVPSELAELRKRGWKIAILSNTDPELLDLSIKRIGVEVDVRITVAEAGSYKPAPGHWERFFETTETGKDEAVHVAASLFHDIEPAWRMGLHRVWINRADESTQLPIHAQLPDLRTLADVLDGLIAPG